MATHIHAQLGTEPVEVYAGQPTTLIFTVKDDVGTLVRDLQVSHEKPMHLLIVSEDLSEFDHLHPEQVADGAFHITHTFPYGGNYRLYVDFRPFNADPVVDHFNLAVNGNVRPGVALIEDTTSIKTIDGLRVTMTADKPLRPGGEAMLNFAVADASTNEPVTDLQPYLGALAHFVIISQDGMDFLHAHPMEKAEMNGVHGHHGHGGHQTRPHRQHHDTMGTKPNAPQVSASEVSAHTIFPRVGLYKVWAQFQRDGRVITIPFVVRVA
jgi:hypothetical protein